MNVETHGAGQRAVTGQSEEVLPAIKTLIISRSTAPVVLVELCAHVMQKHALVSVMMLEPVLVHVDLTLLKAAACAWGRRDHESNQNVCKRKTLCLRRIILMLMQRK